MPVEIVIVVAVLAFLLVMINWLVTRNLARTDNVSMEAWNAVSSADCEMMAVVGFGIALGCVVMLVVFWRVLPWLIRQ